LLTALIVLARVLKEPECAVVETGIVPRQARYGLLDLFARVNAMAISPWGKDVIHVDSDLVNIPL
jgi:hypothetical protein